jgi:arylformamidase
MQLQREIARSSPAVAPSGEPWIDVSVPIRAGMFHWPGNPAVAVEQTEHLRWGDAATVSWLSLGVHTGTHVDAPAHFILDGGGVESIDLDRLIGRARVLVLGHVAQIQPREREGQGIGRGDRILFKTRNSRYWRDQEFRPDYTSLSLKAAEWLAERGVRAVGIDYLSIASMDMAPETHRPLLAAGIAVIEGLDLSAVDPGPYQLVCLPLRLEGIDGAPARVLLRKLLQPAREDPGQRWTNGELTQD